MGKAVVEGKLTWYSADGNVEVGEYTNLRNMIERANVEQGDIQELCDKGRIVRITVEVFDADAQEVCPGCQMRTLSYDNGFWECSECGYVLRNAM